MLCSGLSRVLAAQLRVAPDKCIQSFLVLQWLFYPPFILQCHRLWVFSGWTLVACLPDLLYVCYHGCFGRCIPNSAVQCMTWLISHGWRRCMHPAELWVSMDQQNGATLKQTGTHGVSQAWGSRIVAQHLLTSLALANKAQVETISKSGEVHSTEIWQVVMPVEG